MYEYLLALDAARPLETTRARVDQPAAAAGSPMVGAEEVAALGHASQAREDAQALAEGAAAAPPTVEEELSAAEAAGQAADADDAPDAPASRRRFGLRRRQRSGAEAAEGVAETSEVDDSAVEQDPTAPAAEPATPTLQVTTDAEPPMFDPGFDLAPAADAALEPAADAALEPATETGPDAVIAGPEQAADAPAAEPATPDAGPGFVAPRAGFHIVEDSPAHRADQDEPRLEMPAFSVDEAGETDPATATAAETATVEAASAEPAPDEAPPAVADGPVEAAAIDPEAADVTPPARSPRTTPPRRRPPRPAQPATRPCRPETDPGFLAWRVPGAEPAPAPLPTAAAEVSTFQQPPVEPADPEEDEADGRGWGVRRHGDARSTRRGAPAVAVPHVEDDPFENNTRLSDMRRRIEERLRRKRCDEAAALLQEIAQETGGRAVAELAMNAGDRCRALGKSNAALNCYLAAARSDPVYELPLSRLADICIDNQDTDLAVSYLERIARIYRFRGEDRAALRTYRRIATIAPYREDVLTLLMNAQRTGQLE